ATPDLYLLSLHDALPIYMEMEIPWDEPVPDDMISKVVEYCKNDVDATEAVFHARKGDFLARQILADLSGLSVNDSTNAHTTKIRSEEHTSELQSRFDLVC